MIHAPRTPGRTLAFCGAAAVVLTLCACNQGGGQPAQAGSASVAQALPPPPAPPPVPRNHRSADQEERWQRYLEARQAYDAELAQARAEGRAEQSYVDQGRQDQAFAAGRHDQAVSDRWAQSNAFNAGRGDQAAADRWRQAGAFSAGRVDQASIDQAERDLAAANHQAQFEPDPRRRAQILTQARAELAAAQQGR